MLSMPERIDHQHCIFTKQYAVYTPPMHEMINLIGDWIDQQLPGGSIFGASRLGKTKCIQFHLIEVLKDRFKAAIPLVVWNHKPDSHLSEAGFWHQILLASQFEFMDPAKPFRRMEGSYLCKQRFIAIANNALRNYIVLLIDEAQDLTLKEWKWLVGLQNELDFSGYLLSVISVGTHQLAYKHEFMASTGNAHVAARFMATHDQFHGLRSEYELQYVLNGYDLDSEWPRGSCQSFLEYFAPQDFLAGRRLSDSAPDFWKALVELTPATAKKYTEFPMQHIAKTTEFSNAAIQLSTGQIWYFGEEGYSREDITLGQAIGRLRTITPMPETIEPLFLDIGELWLLNTRQFPLNIKTALAKLHPHISFKSLLLFYKKISSYSLSPPRFIAQCKAAQAAIKVLHGSKCQCCWGRMNLGWVNHWIQVDPNGWPHWTLICPYEAAGQELELGWGNGDFLLSDRKEEKETIQFILLSHHMHDAGLIEYTPTAQTSEEGYLYVFPQVWPCCEWINESPLTCLLNTIVELEVELIFSDLKLWLCDLDNGLGPDTRRNPSGCIRLSENAEGLLLIRWACSAK